MAGGKGTRLGPYSALFPKPLAPLGNEMPVLELLLRQFKAAGVTEVILAVNHLHHLLRAFFGDGEALGISIRYSLEDKPLGTAGPLGAVIDDLQEDFFVANGDLLTTVDFGALRAAHLAADAAVTVASYRRDSKIDFGVLETDSGGFLQNYREKPTYSHLVSMGLYVMKRTAVVTHLTPGSYLDIPDLLMAMTRSGKKVLCHAPECFWLDIGRPDDYQQAQDIFTNNRQMFLKDTP
jgi:NDP-sugar pyrophosphorylase family protein